MGKIIRIQIEKLHKGAYLAAPEIPIGYTGHLIEWPEVVTEGKNLEEILSYLVT
jgi:hypothetical protein